MSKYTDFISSYPLKKYKKGTIILSQDDIPTAVHVVKSGYVKVYNITSDGDELPILFDISYEAFPIGWIFDKIQHTNFFYEAFTDVELYRIPKADFLEFLKKEPGELWRALDYYVDRHVSYQLRMHALGHSKAREKIVCSFEFLVRRFGGPNKGGKVTIGIPITQQDFANFMGLTRETTSLELNKLQREKIITYEKQEYIVDMKRLQELLDDI